MAEAEFLKFLNFKNCAHVHQFSAKEIIFISRTHDKTKCKIKENQYETDSKEKPIKMMTTSVINSVQQCGLEHQKKCYSQQTTCVILYPPNLEPYQFPESLIQFF